MPVGRKEVLKVNNLLASTCSHASCSAAASSRSCRSRSANGAIRSRQMGGWCKRRDTHNLKAKRHVTAAGGRPGASPASCVPGSRAWARLSGMITPRRRGPGARQFWVKAPALRASGRPGTQVGTWCKPRVAASVQTAGGASRGMRTDARVTPKTRHSSLWEMHATTPNASSASAHACAHGLRPAGTPPRSRAPRRYWRRCRGGRRAGRARRGRRRRCRAPACRG